MLSSKIKVFFCFHTFFCAKALTSIQTYTIILFVYKRIHKENRKMKLNNLIAKFLVEQTCRGNTSFTLDYYRVVLTRFLDFCGDIPSDELTLELCQSIISTCEPTSSQAEVSKPIYAVCARSLRGVTISAISKQTLQVDSNFLKRSAKP